MVLLNVDKHRSERSRVDQGLQGTALHLILLIYNDIIDIK